eukprot:7243591-Prymnesium_polylepis.1
MHPQATESDMDGRSGASPAGSRQKTLLRFRSITSANTGRTSSVGGGRGRFHKQDQLCAHCAVMRFRTDTSP